MSDSTQGFVPPPYPYDRLNGVRATADQLAGGAVDLSIGTPVDAPDPAVVMAMTTPGVARGYPPSLGTPSYRASARRWMQRRFGVDLAESELAACIGTKEVVASMPRMLSLRDPSKDTVLYPEISYPTYAMGATLAGLRAVAVSVDSDWRIDLSSISDEDAERALILWVNSPGNPAGGLDDLGAAVQWAQDRNVILASDECYAEFTWDTPFEGLTASPARTALQHGRTGVLAVHSLSKRSNAAGIRAGFYAGDPELIFYLSEVRKHAGMMVPGPIQSAAAVAFDDDAHVEVQRATYRDRLDRMAAIVRGIGLDVDLPSGGFYLWVKAPDGDGWSLVDQFARRLGVVASPGEFYGEAGSGFARLALVCDEQQLQLIESRL